MLRLFGEENFDENDVAIAVTYLTTNVYGEDQELSTGANLYEERLLQFMAFLASYPQMLKQ